MTILNGRFLMIDLLELKIPFDASLVDTVDERHSLIGVDLRELDHKIKGKMTFVSGGDTYKMKIKKVVR